MPFLRQVRNRTSFLFSILFGSHCVLVLTKKVRYSIPIHDYYLVKCILALKQYSLVYEDCDEGIKVSFDGVNCFKIPARSLSRQNHILIILLAEGIKDGAIFIQGYKPIQRKTAVYILQEEPARIITSEGIVFRLDSINPGGIIETYVRRIHETYAQPGIILDVGASFGDTPLYFAANGAKVYAIEMVGANFDQMLANLELNPHLASCIIPIHAAVGKDNTVSYGVDRLNRVQTMGGATFVTNKYGENTKTEKVQGATISTIVKQYGINRIDLLKMDCKGCEFFLKKEDLDIVKKIKIEYYSLMTDHMIQTVMSLLNELGYHTIMYKHTPNDTTSMKKHGNILAER